MDKLYNWSITRSGASLTINHSTGKITGVLRVSPVKVGCESPAPIVAVATHGRAYELVVA